MRHSLRGLWGRLIRKLSAQFVTGIIALIPLGATMAILIWAFNATDNVLQPVISRIWGHPVRGIGFAVAMLLIYLVGVTATNVVGRRLIHYGESVLPWMPIVHRIYWGIKEIVQAFSAPDKAGFLQVVLVEFPRRGMKAVGFVTSIAIDQSGQKVYNILIPTAPNPLTGFLQMVREIDIIRTDITFENALKMIVSAGRVSPKEIAFHHAGIAEG